MVNYTYTFDNFAQFNSVFLKMREHIKNKNYNYNFIDVSSPYAITPRTEDFYGKKPYLQIGGINSQEGEGENKWTLSIRKLTHLNKNEKDELTDVFDKYILEARENENLEYEAFLEFLLKLHNNIEGGCGNILLDDFDKHDVRILQHI